MSHLLPRPVPTPVRLAEETGDPAAKLVLRFGTLADHATVEQQLSDAAIIKTRTSAGVGDFIGKSYLGWIEEMFSDEQTSIVLLIELHSNSQNKLAAMYVIHVFPGTRDTWWGGLRVNTTIRRCGLGKLMFTVKHLPVLSFSHT